MSGEREAEFLDGRDSVSPRDIPRSRANERCGACVFPSDIGIDGLDHKGPAYVNPTCFDHGDDPAHPYEEARVHVLHSGPMGVCRCGAYRDDHEGATA